MVLFFPSLPSDELLCNWINTLESITVQLSWSWILWLSVYGLLINLYSLIIVIHEFWFCLRYIFSHRISRLMTRWFVHLYFVISFCSRFCMFLCFSYRCRFFALVYLCAILLLCFLFFFLSHFFFFLFFLLPVSLYTLHTNCNKGNNTNRNE